MQTELQSLNPKSAFLGKDSDWLTFFKVPLSRKKDFCQDKISHWCFFWKHLRNISKAIPRKKAGQELVAGWSIHLCYTDFNLISFSIDLSDYVINIQYIWSMVHFSQVYGNIRVYFKCSNTKIQTIRLIPEQWSWFFFSLLPLSLDFSKSWA